MVDSVTASDLVGLPCELVAGYVDGRYKWTDADWALFPDKVKVRIATSAATNDGHVLDVEDGAAFPTQAPAWVRMRRAAGVDPTCYVNMSNVGAVRQAFVASGDPLPHLWLAHYDNDPTLLPGYVAKQYANAALTGGHYDASVVADFWPGVDGGDVTEAQVRAIVADYIANTYGPALEAELQQRLATYVRKTDPVTPHPHTASTTVT